MTPPTQLQEQAARNVDQQIERERQQRIAEETAKLEVDAKAKADAELKQRRKIQPQLKKAVAALLESDEEVENLAASLALACADNVKLFAAVDEIFRSVGITDLSSIKSAHACRPTERLWRYLLAVVRPIFQRDMGNMLGNREAQRWVGTNPSGWDREAMQAIAAKHGLKI